MSERIITALLEHPGAMRGVVELVDDDVRVVVVNSATARTFGSAPADLSGRTARDLGVSERSRATWLARLIDARDSGKPVTFEYEFERDNGARTLRASVTFAGPGERGPLFTFAAEDITALTTAESALRRTEASYATLVRNLSGAVYRCDAARTHLELISEQSVGITGYHAAELMAGGVTTLDALIHPDDIADVRSRYRANIEARNECSIEYRIVHRDGSVRWVWDRAQGVRSDDGSLLHVDGLIIDVTQRRQEAAERQALREQLSHMQRVDSVGRLAGGVAHDFNNLLAVVLGHTELIAAQMTEDDPIAENISEIRNATDRSMHLTRQLLGFASRQSITPRVIDFNEVIAETLRLLRRLIGEGVDLRWMPDPATWPVRIDPTQLDQILTNLCVNARDAMRGSGHITVTTSNVTLDAEFTRAHPGARAGEHSVLTVVDDGSGMEPAVLAKVFEPFFTTKARGRGTGLGLSTVYGILKQNDGYIHIQSSPGVGTTVNVYLPRHAEPSDEEIGVDEIDLEMEGGTETILLVEDEPALLRITKRVLSRLGYIVLSAATPNDAVRRIMLNLDRVDLLLTDIVLPEMNGVKLAEFLKAQKPGLPVLFMSGYADTAFDDGVVPADIHFIAKPFTPQQLAVKVREALAGPPQPAA